MKTQKIVVLATGGTLAGTASDPSDSVGYKAAQLGIGQLLASIAALSAWTIESEQVAQVDSKDMSFAIWRELALRCEHWLAQDDVQGIVITHGTDTIEETAFFLQQALLPDRPVVLTCAMRPATALGADGPRNIVDAVTVASTEGAKGVMVVCAGVIHDARAVAKVHHYRLDPFSSGDTGPLGYVEEGKLRMVRSWPVVATLGRWLDKVRMAASWPRVEIVTSHTGAAGAMVNALRSQGVDGLVVAATGNGTVHEDLLAALLEAQRAGVKVLRASRTAQGGIIATPADSLPATSLSPVKARIQLLLELM